MSTLMHPVGPRPPGTYWVRRVLVLVVLLALLLGVRWLVTGRGGTPSASPSTAPTAAASGTPTPTVSATPKPSATSTPSTTATPTPSATKTPSASSTSVKACPDSAITVTASTDAASYTVGSTPRLRMRIQNTGGTTCTRDIGAAQNELVISSGSTRVWSSDDCNKGGTPQLATLSPDQSYSVSVTWLGHLSTPSCPPDQPLAQKGTYKLVGRNGEVLSKPAIFSLT